jgi:WD40 repeat protein
VKRSRTEPLPPHGGYTTIELIERRSRTVVTRLPGHQEVFEPISPYPPRGVEHLLFTDDGSALISIGRYDRRIKLWALDSGQVQWKTEIEGDRDFRDRLPVRRIGLTGNGQYLFLLGGILPTGATGFVSLYSLEDGSEVERFERSDLGIDGPGMIRSVDLSPDGEYLALSMSSGIRVQKTDTKKPMWHRQLRRAARFSADGQSVIALTPGSSIVAHDLKTGELIEEKSLPASEFGNERHLAVATDNHRSLTAS